MFVTTRTSPPTTIEPDADPKTTREAFLDVGNTAKCFICPSVGNFILNENTNNHQTVQCKACSANFSGPNLHELIQSAKSAKKQPAKTSSRQLQRANSSVSEPSAAAYATLKLENAKLPAAKTAEAQESVKTLRYENGQLALVNTVVKTQNEQLLGKINSVKAASTSVQTENKRLQLRVDYLTTTVSSMSEKIAEVIVVPGLERWRNGNKQQTTERS